MDRRMTRRPSRPLAPRYLRVTNVVLITRALFLNLQAVDMGAASTPTQLRSRLQTTAMGLYERMDVLQPATPHLPGPLADSAGRPALSLARS
ncbi:hypothetical protein FKP32DRAFT_1591287 [Trametes sanguinea]|nr:hypothetical protein FKP32DRAFT_1591287 [Trametes sanguinea]